MLHGGRGEDQQDAALYYFGPATGPAPDTLLHLTQIAPTVLARLGVQIPDTMKEPGFLNRADTDETPGLDLAKSPACC